MVIEVSSMLVAPWQTPFSSARIGRAAVLLCLLLSSIDLKCQFKDSSIDPSPTCVRQFAYIQFLCQTPRALTQ